MSHRKAVRQTGGSSSGSPLSSRRRLNETLPPETVMTTPDAAARTLRLFGDRRPAAAEAAGRRAARVLDHRQLRGLGYRAADGAAGAAGADRRAAAARRAELELARIRHAGRLLAVLRSLRAARHPADARDQCARLRGLSARRRAGQAARLGVHGPLLRAGADPQASHDQHGDDPALARHPREVHRHASGRLARTGPDADARHARHSSPKPA